MIGIIEHNHVDQRVQRQGQITGQGRPPCRVLKIPDQRKTNLSEKSALVNLLLCDFWIWFGF